MMALRYRTYDRAWNRVGYADVPQYPGQPGIIHDFDEPVRAVWLGRNGYQARTADGRVIDAEEITS